MVSSEHQQKLEMLQQKLQDYFGFDPYTFKSDSYRTVHDSLNLFCNTCGSIFTSNANDLCRAIRENRKEPYCKSCANAKCATSKTATVEYYNDRLKEVGLEGNYVVSNFNGMTAKCQHECSKCSSSFEAIPNNVINSKKTYGRVYCPSCASAKARGTGAPLELYQEKFKEFGFEEVPYSISNFVNMGTDCTHTCNECNSTFEANPQNVIARAKKGLLYCSTCNNKTRSLSDYPARLVEVGSCFVALEEFVNRRTKILHKCKVCGIEELVIPNNVLKGSGCANCLGRNKISGPQQFILDTLKELGVNCVSNQRILNGKEVDVFIPEHNIGIEVNGAYWHSEEHKPMNYHLEKLQAANALGIRLLFVYDTDILEKPEIVKAKLEYVFNKTKGIAYSRNCYIRVATNEEKKVFLVANHLQGDAVSSINLGLFDKDEHTMVALMTFGQKRAIFGYGKTCEEGPLELELIRFAILGGFSVPGAFTKLFKYFLSAHSEVNSVISYADRDLYEGGCYVKAGFVLCSYSKPSYFYYHKRLSAFRKKLHRYNFAKHKLKEHIATKAFYREELSESEIMKAAGFIKVWNTGNSVFRYTRVSAN